MAAPAGEKVKRLERFLEHLVEVFPRREAVVTCGLIISRPNASGTNSET